MIPASYLFKDVFHNTWYEPDIEAAKDRHDVDGRRAQSWLSRLSTLFHRRAARGRAYAARPVSAQL